MGLELMWNVFRDVSGYKSRTWDRFDQASGWIMIYIDVKGLKVSCFTVIE